MAGRRKQRPAVSPAARAAFVEAVGAGWTVSQAARQTGVARQRFYELRDADETFQAEWAEADEQGVDRLRDEAYRRAVEGVRDFRLDKDGNEHELRVYSDKLMELLLKHHDHGYRERTQVEIAGANAARLEVGLRIEPDFQAILSSLEAAGVLTRGPAAGAALAEAAALQREALKAGDGGAAPPGGDPPA